MVPHHRKFHEILKNMMRFGRKPEAEQIPIPYPFNHRENLLNLLVLSDLLIFFCTICYMELSQSMLLAASDQSILYQISPLSLFQHHCDSYWTYIWILLFNLSSMVALCIVVLSIYAIHQTSFEPSCIMFLLLTLVAFVTVSVFPIIAFISFFKLSIFAISCLTQSNLNVIPAIYSERIYFPIQETLNNADTDRFYQKLYLFIYGADHNKQARWSWRHVLSTWFTACLIPIFALFDFETLPLSDSILDGKSHAEHQAATAEDEEYELRISIANKTLARHYSTTFWVPTNTKHIAQKLTHIPYSQCTIQLIRHLRGYTVCNIWQSIRKLFISEFRIWSQSGCRGEQADDGFYPVSFYDAVLDAQYAVVLFVFVPLQTVFVVYGLCYPYIVLFAMATDLYQSLYVKNTACDDLQHEIIRLVCLNQVPLVSLLHEHYFWIYAVCLSGHLMTMYCVLRKLWHLRYVFEMCVNVLLVSDSSVLDSHGVIDEMVATRRNLNATQIRDYELAKIFGRYHLDALIIQYAGTMHECD